MENLTPHISKHERETAIRVLMRSRIVMNWVKAEAAFLNIQPGSPKWGEFFRREARKAAIRLIR